MAGREGTKESEKEGHCWKGKDVPNEMEREGQ